MIPFAYVIQIDSQVPGNEHGFVEGELVARAAHTHAL